MKHFFLLIVLLTNCLILSAQSGNQLPPWAEGFMDIHHISTGRGNCTFCILPDGTTLLIDAGDISDTHPRTLSERNSTRKPNASKETHEWIVDYIKQFHPKKRDPKLDYAWITHYHDDHFGEWDPYRKESIKGDYVLTGITGVGDLLQINNLLDRGFLFPVSWDDSAFRASQLDDEYHIVQTLDNYRKFIDYFSQQGMQHETINAGSDEQIKLRINPFAYPDFSIRNIAVNGNVWTGSNTNDHSSRFQQNVYPGENELSACMKISYGQFDYFTGGDISGIDSYGQSDMTRMESYVAPVVGPVDVATLNHHGNRDSMSPYFVRTLRPRVWIGQSWSSDHPGQDVLRRISSHELYPGERDLFATDMLASNELVIGDAIKNLYKSTHGHVVIRVYDNGDNYDIYILDDSSEKRELKSQFGPYKSR